MKKNTQLLFRQKLDELSSLQPSKNKQFNSTELLTAAENLLTNNQENFPRDILHKYLNLTRSPFFLSNLKNREERYRWAETTFKAIRASEYSLLDLINQRVELHPEKILFSAFEGSVRNNYSYKSIADKISNLAAAFYKHLGSQPKIAIYSDNCIEGALCDLACLSYNIFVSPLHSHFSSDNFSHIFSLLKFNIVVTDTIQRVELLKSVRESIGYDFSILLLGNQASQENKKDNILKFYNFISSVDNQEVPEILEKRNHFKPDDISTVMFTSGSTGIPKGVGFTNYNLITKRFARGAALSEVGNDETLLCYLPLFHTFGRYFEMLGTIYWGGTYVFAGKNDIESLLQLMKKVKPTGFVSIPLRWKEIYEHVNEQLENLTNKKSKQKMLGEIVGENLRWGISAAGYLEPKVFKFFNANSIALCSGFGMTEATGGISMTPPGEYVKDSVGIPLPGIQIRFTENGELEFSGHYAAKYLDNAPNKNLKDDWIKTGDLFTQDENGFLYIVDRIKDIYKNIKGQTIAPSFIEKKFEKIPGIKRAFLVGDMKPYNTLLIVPDLDEPFIQQAESQHKLKSYFGTLISSVNKTLNPYEKIVKFIILNRNFEESKGELTSKGTFKRKIIEYNFKKTIDELYAESNLRCTCGGVNIIVPVWALKDLGITENDLFCSSSHLTNKENDTRLTIRKTNYPGRIKIGNFEYVIKYNEIDLGVFILQPILWLGNKELIEFFVCKEEWDVDFQNISSQIFFNHRHKNVSATAELRNTDKFDAKTKELNAKILKALYGSETEILNVLTEIEKLLAHGEYRINNLLSRRVEALASHPKFSIRSEAYKILLFNKPDIDYNKYFPAFINSGLTFLNKIVVENIFKDNIEGFNLDAFRKRLEAYRKGLSWPANERTRQQFKRVLELLISFVHKNPSAYAAVRVELISWILHTVDPVLSRYAQKLFNKLSRWFELGFKSNSYERSVLNWKEKIIYQDNISDVERVRINKILSQTTFLKEAFMLIYDLLKFDLKEIKQNGIFISTISSSADKHLYRISINTKHFKHYDLVVLFKPDITRHEVLKTIYMMIKISRGADGTIILPKLGNFRSKLGIISFEFINDLTVWERIRMLNSAYSKANKNDYEFELKLLFTRGMAAYFRVLKNSDYKIIPGNFSPSNAVVPESHFMKGSLVVSISGWTEFKNYEEFISHLYNNFYLQTYAHYPVSKDYIKIEWIFDACMEALGNDKGLTTLSGLLKNLQNKKANHAKEIISQSLSPYIDKINSTPYINSYICSAIKNYNDWIEENPSPIKEAMENFVNNLFSLYRLDKYSEIDRYIFYVSTYFSSAPEDVNVLFSRLINSLFNYPDESVLSRVELVELQEVMKDETDKRVLNKLIFPSANQNFALITEKDSDDKEVILKTQAADSFGVNYTIRKPLSAFEIASLHKLFILDNYPVRIEPALQYLVIIDEENEDRIVGGICYKIQYMNVAHLEGIDIYRTYRKRGLGGIVIEDFCNRLKSNGIKTLTTHFYLRSFFEKFGFKMDFRWGGLARRI